MAQQRAPAGQQAAGAWTIESGQLERLAARVVASGGNPRTVTVAPFTGAPLAELPTSSPDDVATAVARARAAQPSWAARSGRERSLVLLRVHDLVLQHQSELLDLIQMESGKSRIHAYEEVADVALGARHYARRGPALLAEEHRPGLAPRLTRVSVSRRPWGVVGLIVPWNYPLTLAVSDALPALLAGNAVVLKPDTRTALTALRAAALLEDAGLPADLLQVVLGDGPVIGSALVDAVDYLSFTGSTASGRQVAQRAAGRLIGASLELGGKNPLYVADDADLDRAAEAAVRDCFASAGQLCVSVERLLLHERIAQPFLERFVERVRRLRLGPALDFSVDLGCLASPAQLARVQAHVADASARGATVLVGGRHRPDLGPLFYEPTVLDHVAPEAMCFTEETFGPVVSVRRVSTDAEAVACANDTRYGLSATIWTRDLRRGRRLAGQIRAGSVNVNESYLVSWGSVGAPIGGWGESGIGRRHGAEGLLRYTQSQTVAVQRRPGLGVLYAGRPGRLPALFTAALRAARTARLPWP